MKYYTIFAFALLLSFAACKNKQDEKVVAPWGEVSDSIPANDNFDLDQREANGEMIMVTLSGPESYYDYHGKSLGSLYMLAQKFADKVGVMLRVEVCRDSAEVTRKIASGDADLSALMDSTGVHWLVNKDKPQLRAAIDSWYKPKMLKDVKREEAFLLSSRSVHRHVYAPMLNKAGGVISHYDGYFIAYSRATRWDWRLMAAQCYQESTFDPNARSWAGALGLMQIMPSTAAHLGLPIEQIHQPEANIAAGARYLQEIESRFMYIRDRYERENFVLACYNGGYHHIKDAQALTQKYGGNPQSWEDVSRYVLQLTNPQYYRDPVVKYGYMRGYETVDYVNRIRQRWASYRGVRGPRVSGNIIMAPRKATHRRNRKYNV